MSINKVEDLLDELKWTTLFEILWGKHIEYEIDTKLSKKEIKKENHKQIIQYLKAKKSLLLILYQI